MIIDQVYRSLLARRAIVLALATVIGLIPCSAKSGVVIEKDLAFLGPERSEKLDLYYPPNHFLEKAVPAIVVIHGGGWWSGDKGKSREVNIGTNLARSGYICASINYELAKVDRKEPFNKKLAAVWPRNLQDCKVAVRYLRSRAFELGIRADRIGAIGGSAGGHLVAALGYTDESDGMGDSLQYPEYSSRVQAIVPMYGAHDMVYRLQQENDVINAIELEFCRVVSTITYLTSDDPPTLVIHGTKDITVDPIQARLLLDSGLEVGIEIDLLLVEGGQHSFDLQPPELDLRPVVIDFLTGT